MLKAYSDIVIDVGFQCDADEIEDIRAFHERTKSTRASDYKTVKLVHEYLFQDRALLETVCNRKDYFSKPVTDLPPPAKIEMSLSEVYQNRHSVRNFLEKKTSLQNVSTILSCLRACRTMRPDGREDVAELTNHLRPYPSPGALYPCEIYVTAWGNLDAPPGVYHYNPIQHNLRHITTDFDKDAYLLAMGERGMSQLKNAGFTIAITSIFERVAVKYSYMGYRFAMMETGVVSMQLANAVVGAGLGCLLWGGYYDDAMNAQLGVDGKTETITGALWVGHNA